MSMKLSRRKRLMILMIVGWSISFGVFGLAQMTTATISGTAKDETGAVLPGVTVTVVSLETGLSRTVLTDDGGRYRIPNLSLGDSEVRAELGGFQSTIRRGIKLTVGREAIVDFTLKVGEMTEKVEVTAEAPLVETTRASISGLVDEKTMRDLPLNARSFDQLALLHPGVVNARQTQGFTLGGWGLGISASGARVTQNSYLLDGTDINNLVDQPGSIAGVLLGVDAVREFEILINSYSAEYGRGVGAVISAATRSGTNEFHGSVFQFHRNDNLDARNFFDRGRQPEFKRNQFGLAAGGPIVKNKTFFFGTYEGLRERLGVTKTATVPNALARQGLLPDPQTPGRLTDVGVASGIKPYLDLYPLPNGPDFGDGTGFFSFFKSQPTDEDYFQIRIDTSLSDNGSFFGRYTLDDAARILPFELPQVDDLQASRNQYLTLEEKHTLSPRLLNVIRFGFNRSKFISNSAVDESIPLGLSFIPGRPIGRLEIRGLTSLGINASTPRQNLQNMFELTESVTYVRGRHSFKAGANVKRFQANVVQDINRNGLYNFDSLRNFLGGRTTFFEGMALDADSIRGFRQTLFGFYGQDDIQLLPNLTLNLGLRHEFITKPSEVNGKGSTLPGALAPDVVVGDILLHNPSLKNLAPRLGFAWDPLKDGKTSVRGGFGIFYQQVLPRQYFALNAQTPPFFLRTRILGNVPFPRGGFEAFRAGGVPLGSLVFTGLHPFIDTPSMMHWNFNVQKEVVPSAVFTVGYAGSRGIHLESIKDSNTAIPQILPDGRKFFPAGLRRRNPNFSQIQFFLGAANSFYHSFQLTFNKRYGKTPIGPVQYQLSYTFAKSIDDATSELGTRFSNTPAAVQDPDDLQADRGLSGFDVRHNLVGNFVYEIPSGNGLRGVAKEIASGWQINGITTVTSGVPVNVQLGFNRSRNLQTGGRLGDRPNLKPGFSNNPTREFKTPDQWLDKNAFELQPAGFYGNLGRDTVIGPKFVNLDFSVFKNTLVPSISENFNIQFRAEFFNFFNHPNFATPRNGSNGIIIFNDASGRPLGNAGRIFDTVSTSRQIQFGIKIIW